MKKIAIYTDQGAHPIGIKMLKRSLQLLELDKKYQISTINGKKIGEKSWVKETALLIIPGGRDLFYHRVLRGGPNEIIKTFVKNGGKYLGICAGGYYGASSIEFEKGYPLEVIGIRELGFFPGVAIGPAYGPNQFNYENENGSRVSKLQCYFTKERNSASYFNGGCKFQAAENFENVTILGRYSDLENNPAAIVECRFGKGYAILSGVHPEYNLSSFANELEKTRLILFKNLLERLLNYE